MTEETAIVRAPRPPIGRIISVVVWGVADRDSPVETDIADAILTATANHGLKPVIASGPYYSDEDERDQELAKVTAERDELAKLYEAATIVLVGHLDANCSVVAQVRERATAAGEVSP
jgi:hypothetical protein